MLRVIAWIRLLLSYCLFAIFMVLAWYYQTSVYLCYQASGQLSILLNREEIGEFKNSGDLTPAEKDNIQLVEKIKNYSVDTLDYLPTNNFTKIYNQKRSPVLWVITACEPYALEPYTWEFPVVGKVSYKGFFIKDLAIKEYNHLRARGYDVDLRSVSAWSTLGWFNDPLLSGILSRGKGALCNLLFHELFHATYYAPGQVNFNENIASFIAHKATLQFLKNDTASLNEYVKNYADNLLVNRFLQRQNQYLRKFYASVKNHPSKYLLKLKAIHYIADSVGKLSLRNHWKTEQYRKEILDQKNAYFVDYEQYDSMQDSLEKAFNKIYKGNLKKLVQDLKQNQTIIKFGN